MPNGRKMVHTKHRDYELGIQRSLRIAQRTANSRICTANCCGQASILRIPIFFKSYGPYVLASFARIIVQECKVRCARQEMKLLFAESPFREFVLNPKFASQNVESGRIVCID